MNIVICEDSISDRHKLEKAITKVLIKNNLNSEIILSTNNSADVLNYANKNNQFLNDLTNKRDGCIIVLKY